MVVLVFNFQHHLEILMQQLHWVVQDLVVHLIGLLVVVLVVATIQQEQTLEVDLVDHTQVVDLADKNLNMLILTRNLTPEVVEEDLDIIL
jgi:hypothetical protein